VRFERIRGARRVGVRRSPAIRPGPAPPEITTPTDRRPVQKPAARREPKQVSVWSFLAASLVLSALMFAFFLLGDRGLWDLRRQRARLANLQTEVSTLAAENARLENEVARLRNDPAASEKIAREELNFVRPGDVVLVLPKGWTEKAAAQQVAKKAFSNSQPELKPENNEAERP
jgi:cell division protein FtsB